MSRWIGLGILVAFGCSGSGSDSCITREDCREDQICVNGGCSLIPTDGSVIDTALSDAASESDVVDVGPADGGDGDSGPAVDSGPVDCRDSGCSADRLCDGVSGSCVECLADTDCASGTCVRNTCSSACVDSSQCTTPEAPVCSAGVCAPCRSNEECAGVSESGVSLSVCDAGLCVQCTESERFGCRGFSCDPMMRRCTSTFLGSVDHCRACASDAECADGACIPMFYRRDEVGSFCLRSSGGLRCPIGYSTIVEAVSTSGVAGSYCSIHPATTCQAFLTFGRGCAAASDCGQGGVCEGLLSRTCTFACDTSRDCPLVDGMTTACDVLCTP